jgi:hypothetical protein
MKKVILLLSLFIFVNVAYSQWQQFTIPYSYSDMSLTISNPAFPSADVGYVIASVYITESSSYDYSRVYRTTNKGINCSSLYNIPFSNPTVYSLCFINTATGYFARFVQSYRPYTMEVYKTINSGQGWSKIGQISNITHPVQPPIPDHIPSYFYMKFVNENTGYLAEWTNVYKTTNGGVNWFTIKSYSNTGYDILDIDISRNDNNKVIFGGYFGAGSLGNPILLKSNDGGVTFTEIENGLSNNPVEGITSISLIEENNNEYIYCAGEGGIGKVTNGGSLELISSPYSFYYFDQKFISFNNANTGVLYADNCLRRSTNGGVNWSEEQYLGNIKMDGITKCGDVVVGSAHDGTLLGQQSDYAFTRKIPIHGQFAFDLIPNPNYSGHFSVFDYLEGGTLYIPGTLEVYGGSLAVEADDKILENGNKIFYRWQTSMNTGYPYIDRTESYITANYKSKLKSTVPNAISPVSQTKAIKDTNGVINVIYESMGGIFYTKSTDNGQTFSMEEIVNYHPTEFSGTDNYNPCLAEIKPFLLNYPPVLGAQNMAAVWERKEGSSIKVRFSKRRDHETYPYVPAPPNNWMGPIDLFTITGVPTGFECKPRLFMTKTGDGYPDSLVAVLYLRPVDGKNQLWIFGKSGSNNYNNCIVSGNNIASFSATAIMQNTMSRSLNIHIAFVQDGNIKYAHGLLEGNQYGAYWTPLLSEDITVSTVNFLQNRGEPDITLRNASNSSENYNMQPVVTYKGQTPVRVIIQNGNDQPQEINITYYPVIVRERLASGNWASGYSQYNSSTIQQSPNIEGSKNRDSYILNFKRGSSTFIQNVVKWEGFFGTNYRCNPCSFDGVDAKFVRGGLFNQYPQVQNLHKLVSSSSIYETGVRAFDINTNPCLRDDPGAEVAGIVVNENMAYSFNLGSIMVNSEIIGFDSELDTTIESGGELNENLKSKPFLLNDNDTLVIGRNAFYLDAGGGNFSEVQYAVYLTNNNTGENFLELARDTVHAGDSIQIEYLEGFVIQNIPGGFDSFYVQMQIDTAWLGGGDDFGLNRISNDLSGGGDAPAIKKMIFWKNAKPLINNIPNAFNLYQNFPNPFNPLTKIKYDLPKSVSGGVNVTIKIYDIIGREVTILVNNEFKKAGRYEVNWNASNYASGVYIYRIQAGDYVSTRKMVLLK